MNNIRKLTDSLFWVGVNDRRIALFENVYPVPTGMSYNSYVLLDEKTALFDTVDASFTHDFLENVTAALNGRTLDYLIVNHMEPDHCASIADVIAAYPEAKIVCTAKAVGMMKQFFDFDMDSRAIPVKEGDTVSLGSHEITFVMAPMVHWPEVMVTYEKTEKILMPSVPSALSTEISLLTRSTIRVPGSLRQDVTIQISLENSACPYRVS